MSWLWRTELGSGFFEGGCGRELELFLQVARRTYLLILLQRLEVLVRRRPGNIQYRVLRFSALHALVPRLYP